MNQLFCLPELLAPAGNMESGIVALDAGADAVYAGLSRFNARERGHNCTSEELSKLIAYAHKNNKRVYVTLNTILKENELNEVAEMLAELAVLRPDALIVQDLGLVRIIRDFFPVLNIHASTQMGIHNSAGANIAESLGINRVILERQVSYEEIKVIRKNTSVELEVFVHGALCCGLSGKCLFSSWMGGWSGNRGKCKQPCRRRYFSEEGNGFFFSTQDFYSLDAIPELKKMGVNCFKIEGRLRNADYVRRTVSAYRMILDAPDKEVNSVLKNSRSMLAGGFGRKWSDAFRTTKDFAGVIKHRTLGTSGLLCGVVTESQKRGFFMKVSKRISLNDTIRIQSRSGDEGPSLTLTRMSVRNNNVTRVRRDEICRIYCDKPVKSGDLVFKTASTPAVDLAPRIDTIQPARPAMDLTIKIKQDSISIKTCVAKLCWQIEVDLQSARNRPLTPETVMEQFRKTRSEKFSAGLIDVEISGDFFLPAAQLKHLRREFWTWADNNIDTSQIINKWQTVLSDLKQHLAQPCTNTASKKTEITVRLQGKKNAPFPKALTAVNISEIDKHTDEVVLPEFCPELKLGKLQKQISAAITKGSKRFRVTSLYGLNLLKNFNDLQITASLMIPACNSQAVDELIASGAEKVTAWIELENKSLEMLLDKRRNNIEVYVYGRIPLMYTRFGIPIEGSIKDGRGAGFTVIKNDDMAYVLPEKVFSMDPPDAISTYYDLTYAELNDPAKSSFNLERNLE